jgi:hypothetical protein
MSRYEYNADLLNSGIQALNDSMKKLDNTSTDFEKGFSMIKGARGAEYLTIDSSEIVQTPKNAQESISSMVSQITSKAQEIEEYNNSPFILKFGASIGMGVTKIGEGIGTAGEQIVDGFASAVGFIGGIFSKDFQNSVGNFVKEDHVGNFFADQYANGALSGINKYSYFSADSTAANVFKGIGIAAGYIGLAAVTGGIGGIAGGAGAASGATAALSNIGLNATIAGIGGLGGGTQKALQSGSSYNQAFGVGVLTGAVQAGTVFAVGKAFEALSKSGLATTGSKTTEVATTGDDASLAIADKSSALGITDKSSGLAITDKSSVLGITDKSASSTIAENAAKATDSAASASSTAESGLEYVKTITKGGNQFIVFKDANGIKDAMCVGRLSTLNDNVLTQAQIDSLMGKAGLSSATATSSAATVASSSAAASVPASTSTAVAIVDGTGKQLPAIYTGKAAEAIVTPAIAGVSSVGSTHLGIALADTGIGIATAKSSEVFKPSTPTVATSYGEPSQATDVAEMSGFKSNIFPLSKEEQNAYINNGDANKLFNNYKAEGYTDSDAKTLAADELAINDLEKSRVDGVIESETNHTKYMTAQEQFQSDLAKAKANKGSASSSSSNKASSSTSNSGSSTSSSSSSLSTGSSSSSSSSSSTGSSVQARQTSSSSSSSSSSTATTTTTSAPTTSAPTTSTPTTSTPTTSTPTTSTPTTSAPTTSTPTTSSPTTSAPVTSTPVTSAPVTSAPVTSAPVTAVPTTPRTSPTIHDNSGQTLTSPITGANTTTVPTTVASTTAVTTPTTTTKITPTTKETTHISNNITSNKSNSGSNVIPIVLGIGAAGAAAVAGTRYIKKKDQEEMYEDDTTNENDFSDLGTYDNKTTTSVKQKDSNNINSLVLDDGSDININENTLETNKEELE